MQCLSTSTVEPVVSPNGYRLETGMRERLFPPKYEKQNTVEESTGSKPVGSPLGRRGGRGGTYLVLCDGRLGEGKLTATNQSRGGRRLKGVLL